DTELRDLTYDVRFFVPDPEAPGVAGHLLGLLSPGGRVTVKEADAFASPSGNHLYPKLRIAVRGSDEFKRDAKRHGAHLSILFDIFPAEHVRAAKADPRESSSPVYGLVQDFHVHYQEDENTVAWHRQPRHGYAIP